MPTAGGGWLLRPVAWQQTIGGLQRRAEYRRQPAGGRATGYAGTATCWGRVDHRQWPVLTTRYSSGLSSYKACDDPKLGIMAWHTLAGRGRAWHAYSLCCIYRAPSTMLVRTPRSACPCPRADAHSRRHSQTSAPAVARRDVVGGLAVLLTWCGPTALAPPISLMYDHCRRPRTKGSRAIRCRSQVDRPLSVSGFAGQRCHSGAATGGLCCRATNRAAGARRQRRGRGAQRPGRHGVRHQRLQLRGPR